MSSLRTDDIFGARPRIRHAPRNLIRQHPLYQRSYIHEPQYMSNVNLSQSISERSPVHRGQPQSSSMLHHDVPLQERPPVLPKQMPNINYEQLPPRQTTPLYQPYQPDKKVKIKEDVQSKQEMHLMKKNEKEKMAYQSTRELKQREEPKASIFRGLGYNIITNNKYSYDMVNNYKHSSSPWLANH